MGQDVAQINKVCNFWTVNKYQRLMTACAGSYAVCNATKSYGVELPSFNALIWGFGLRLSTQAEKRSMMLCDFRMTIVWLSLRHLHVVVTAT